MKNTYGFFYKVKMACWWVRTKFISSRARFIRFPIDIRGKKFIDFGKNLTTGVGCRLEAFSNDGRVTLHFGTDVQLNDYVHITAMHKVTVGNRVLMAGRIYISDCAHGYYGGQAGMDSAPQVPPILRPYHTGPVVIGDNVWLGEGVCVLPGVSIGEGAIIGANSVVKGKIPPYTIAAGAPARVVKRFDFDRDAWFRTDAQGNFVN